MCAHVDPSLAGSATRTDEVKQRCFTALQAKADTLDAVRVAATILHDAREAPSTHADSTVALV